MRVIETKRSLAVMALRLKRLETLEQRYVKKIRDIFSSQERLFLRQLRKYPKIQMEGYAIRVKELDLPVWWEEAWNDVAVSTTPEWKQVMQNLHAPAIVAGANDSLLSLRQEASFNVQNPAVVDYLNANAAKRVSNINDTTRDALRRVIAEGQEKGWSYTQLSKEIGNKFEQFRTANNQTHLRTRADLIAATEVGDAYNEGPLLAARDLQSKGIPMLKSWLTVGDARVSAGCRANAEQGLIGLEKEFSSGHMRPLRFPGCRCSLLTHVDEGENPVEIVTQQPEFERITGSKLDPHFTDWAEALPQSQISSLRSYTGSSYDDVNRALRTGTELTGNFVRTVDELDAAISASPGLPQNTLLYRHMFDGGDVTNMIHAVQDGRLVAGDVIVDPAFVSTSIKSSVIEYSDPEDIVLLTIRAPQGTPGAWLGYSDFSGFDEAEYLLPRDVKMQIVEATDLGHNAVSLVVEVVP